MLMTLELTLSDYCRAECIQPPLIRCIIKKSKSAISHFNAISSGKWIVKDLSQQLKEKWKKESNGKRAGLSGTHRCDFKCNSSCKNKRKKQRDISAAISGCYLSTAARLTAVLKAECYQMDCRTSVGDNVACFPFLCFYADRHPFTVRSLIFFHGNGSHNWYQWFKLLEFIEYDKRMADVLFQCKHRWCIPVSIWCRIDSLHATNSRRHVFEFAVCDLRELHPSLPWFEWQTQRKIQEFII